jgi:alkylation response protein AidB-like acyl-CoA dehydrogenase
MLDRAGEIAEDVLWPSASTVDETGTVPAGHLDLLASAGFYGLSGPVGSGGLGVTDPAMVGRVIRRLASGCLATTFVWLQHAGAVRTVAGSSQPGLAEAWLGPLCRGERRAGAVLGGLRPGPASLVATPVPDGFRLDGVAPWVTGWGMVDVLLTAARVPASTGDPDDDQVPWLLVDPAGQADPAESAPSTLDSLTVRPLVLSAVNASRTVSLTFAGHQVPADRLVGSLPYRSWPALDLAGLRTNGWLALGLVDRCCTLTGPGLLDAQRDAVADRLLDAEPAALPAARAAASELAVQAAALAVTMAGADAVLAGQHPVRLLREAAFLLVFGSRPPIRAELLARLTRAR